MRKHQNRAGSSGLLSRLDEEARRDLMSVGVEVRHADGHLIHQRGDRDRDLSFILEGGVCFSRLDSNGRQTVLKTLGPGESFGEIPLLTGMARTHDAVAVGVVRLLRISPVRFQALLDRQPVLRDSLLANLAMMLSDALDVLDDNQRLSVPQRLARLLLSHMENRIDGLVGTCQQDIATELGASRESVAAALKQLRAAGIVETGYRCIRVIDAAALRKRVA